MERFYQACRQGVGYLTAWRWSEAGNRTVRCFRET